MCALSVCRVCLGSDREMYPLANTALEETYERVTSVTLVVEGWPCCVCGVCLSALRRCRRFIDTAREANDALNLWIQNQSNTLKLVERPLWLFTQTPMACIEVGCQEDPQAGSSSWEFEVKLESDMTENIKGEIINQPDKSTDKSIVKNFLDKITYGDEGDVPTEKVKHAIVIENGIILGMEAIDSDDESRHLHMFDNIESSSPQVLSNMECLDLYKGMIDQQGDHLLSNDIKSDTALTKRTKIKSTHSSRNADPAAIPYDQRNLFSCPQCNDKSQNKQMLKPNDIHTGRNSYMCDECGYTTNENVLLVQHSKNLSKNQQILKKTGGKWFACNRCEYRCRHNFTLKQHLKTHTGEKLFACDKCNYKSNKQFSLKQHLRTHTGEKPFACDKCDSRFSLSSNLKRHLMIHSGEKFACDKCPSRFNRKSSLMQHLTKHADHSDKLNHSGKSKYSDKLNHAGKSKHTGVKRFACDICDYRCRHKFALKLHLRKHTGEKPFACDKCPFRCNQKPGLLRHLMMHTGEKPFACNQCNYKSNQHSGLKAHLMTHTGEKPFACDKCDLKFSLGCNLKRHLRTHTTEKLFVCLMCDAKLKSELTLKNHLRVHTGERPYVCDICESNFTEKRSLKNHIIKVHGTQLVKPV